MEKNIFNKLSTAGIVVATAALIVSAGAVTNAQSNYGYGWTPSADSFKVTPSDAVSGGTPADKADIKAPKKEETKKEDITKTETKKEETTTEAKKDTIAKVLGDKVYTVKNVECEVCANIANPDYNTGKAVSFTDIDNSAYKSEIARLYRNGVVVGTTPTTFEPKRAISRAEFLGIVLKSHGITIEKASSNPFTDLTLGDWKTNVVATALKAGVIAGDQKEGKKVFRPNDAISKIEAMAILTSMRGIEINSEFKHSYKDAAATWQNRVLGIVEYLELDSKADTFKPNDSISREMMANYIVKTISLY